MDIAEGWHDSFDKLPLSHQCSWYSRSFRLCSIIAVLRFSAGTIIYMELLLWIRYRKTNSRALVLPALGDRFNLSLSHRLSFCQNYSLRSSQIQFLSFSTLASSSLSTLALDKIAMTKQRRECGYLKQPMSQALEDFSVVIDNCCARTLP